MKTNYTLIGDVREKLKELPDKSIQMCVTSPPYYGLRNYEDNEEQFGLEKTPEDFINNLVDVFAEVHRVLKDDGTFWLNLGDSYMRPGTDQPQQKGKLNSQSMNKRYGFDKKHKSKSIKLKPKNILGIPFKVAFALQDWGWILRQDIIWHKPNCMPESVKDRFTKNHEYIFLFTKQKNYKFNQILEPLKENSIKRAEYGWNGVVVEGRNSPQKMKDMKRFAPKKGKNKRGVWTIPPASYKEAHFAVFPPKIPELCIEAGSDEGDIVLDCFMGSGTTAMVAQNMFRKWIGIELNPDYEKLIQKRTAQTVLF